MPLVEAHLAGFSLNMRKYKVKKGRHAFWPFAGSVLCNPSYLIYEVVFDNPAKYNLNTNDQFDWNKGGGLSYNMFTNHKNSAMWAWRYSPLYEKFHLTYYVHDGDKIRKGDLDYVTLDPGQKVTITLKVSEEGEFRYWFTIGNNSREFIVHTNSKRKRFARQIGAWFGGNMTAPKKLFFRMKKFIV